jgi:hypothetical protein
MILESAQLLSTTCKLYDIDYGYKSTHAKHPCTLWLLESFQNILWLREMSLHLCDEYTLRYDKEYKSKSIIQDLPLTELYSVYKRLGKPLDDMTSFKQAMPDVYKDDDAVVAYRNYYLGAKRSFAKWKNNKIPEWWL